MPGKTDLPGIHVLTLFFSAFQASSEALPIYMSQPRTADIACGPGYFLFGYFLIACKCLKNEQLECDSVLKPPVTAEHGDLHAFDYSQA